MEELDAAFPSINDPITFAKTQDLPYLNAVINEGMRRMPILALGMSKSSLYSMAFTDSRAYRRPPMSL